MGTFTNQMEALAQGILASTRERSSAIVDIKAHTSSLLSAFDRERATAVEAWKTAVSADCRARAAEFRMRAADVKKMRQGFRRAQDRMRRDLQQKLAQTKKSIGTYVASHFADCARVRSRVAKEHNRMAREQGAELARDRRARFQAVAKFIMETRDRLGQFKQDIQGAHRVWKNLLFAQTRVAAPDSIPGFFTKHPETQRAKERAQAEAVHRRKAEEEQRTKEAGPGKSDDEKRVLGVIRDRPDGISVSRISEVLGLPASLVGRIATALVEQRKVRKNGPSRLYFPR